MKWTQTCVIGGEVHVTSWLSDSSMLREVKSEWKWSCRTQKCRTSIRLTGVLMHQFCWILTSRPVVRRRLPHLLLSTQHWRLQTHCVNSYSRWVNECGWILVLELMTEDWALSIRSHEVVSFSVSLCFLWAGGLGRTDGGCCHGHSNICQEHDFTVKLEQIQCVPVWRVWKHPVTVPEWTRPGVLVQHRVRRRRTRRVWTDIWVWRCETLICVKTALRAADTKTTACLSSKVLKSEVNLVQQFQNRSAGSLLYSTVQG